MLNGNIEIVDFPRKYLAYSTQFREKGSIPGLLNKYDIYIEQ